MLDSIGQILPASAARFGKRTALVCDDRQFSFAELDRMSARVARSLGAAGVREGDRIALCAPNSWQWIVSYYAIARAGCVITPINCRCAADEVHYAIHNCGASAAIVSSDKVEPLVHNPPTRLREIVGFGGDERHGVRSFEVMLNGATPDRTLYGPLARAPSQQINPEDLSTICYTSGTTDLPKGAMQSHRAVVLNAAMTALVHLRTPADRVVHALPLSDVCGTVMMNSALMNGIELIVLERFTPAAALQAIAKHRATIFDGAPTMYLEMLDAPELTTSDVSCLTRCTVAGGSLPPSAIRELESRFGCPLLELWCMTELAGVGTAHTALGPNRRGSIGVPIPYLQCRIVDVADASRPLATDEVGELMVRGPLVMDGYFNDPEATYRAIEPDGWLHTGDLGRIDRDGFVYILDRKQDVILSDNYNLYPAEIERVIAQHPAVATVAVGRMPDPVKGEVAKAYIVPRSGAACTEGDILAFCSERLAGYKLPRAIQFVNDLPKTSNGKVMRGMLPAQEAVTSTGADVFGTADCDLVPGQSRGQGFRKL